MFTKTYRELNTASINLVMISNLAITNPGTKIKVFRLKKWLKDEIEIMNSFIKDIDDAFPKPTAIEINPDGTLASGDEETFLSWLEDRRPMDIKAFDETEVSIPLELFTLQELALIEELPVEVLIFLDTFGLLTDIENL